MQNSEKNLRPGIRKRGKKVVRFHEQKLLKTKPRHISSPPFVTVIDTETGTEAQPESSLPSSRMAACSGIATTAGAMAAITGPPLVATKSAMAGRSARYSPRNSFGFFAG